ncbi:MAG: sulfite exporter TauE/SafE family protein, partial [Burkholderiaceae bacterium]
MSGLDEVVVFLAFAAFAAGFVDAVVGGGGLVQLPALFSSLPQASAASLFGTN